jgi:hypothetical protein
MSVPIRCLAAVYNNGGSICFVLIKVKSQGQNQSCITTGCLPPIGSSWRTQLNFRFPSFKGSAYQQFFYSASITLLLSCSITHNSSIQVISRNNVEMSRFMYTVIIFTFRVFQMLRHGKITKVTAVHEAEPFWRSRQLCSYQQFHNILWNLKFH